MVAVDIENLRGWVGRQETRTDLISPVPVAGLSATLDYAASRAAPGEPLPPLWHWLYFLPATAASAIASDGHARRGAFLPPVPLPRRMWAGSDIRFVAPLYVGDEVERVSLIEDISPMQIMAPTMRPPNSPKMWVPEMRATSSCPASSPDGAVCRNLSLIHISEPTRPY